ncbi:TlpA family protein disulfide reductase [Elizabethkingia bruuniana]|nr:TlpA disulfide reductase family protein [Elizabethkingia bruuniana]QDZ63053.1 TlpA family protein disulfide reductase [Elizabethkingia bruuniana]
MQAFPINKNDINGKPFDLQSLKGKYVLLDFWGSWCMPCRKSHPHMKELYKKYKAEGFEIVGIAQEESPTYEKSRKSWLEAVKKDDIHWIQVLNNEDIKRSDIVKDYGITAFPTKILLDRDGKIIARYVGENNDLDIKLETLFKR